MKILTLIKIWQLQCFTHLSLTIEHITDSTAKSKNYFTSVAVKTKSNIEFLPTHYTDYLANGKTSTIFLTSTDKNEISYKSSGSNSIPVKILKLLKNLCN